MSKVTIAGKEYEFRYRLSDRQDIEKRTQKPLWDSVFSGELSDQVVVMWGGLKHANKNLTPDALLDYLERDMDDTGESYQRHYLVAMRAALTSKVLGNVNTEEVERILQNLEGKGDAKG
jgi:hypothetical protein